LHETFGGPFLILEIPPPLQKEKKRQMERRQKGRERFKDKERFDSKAHG
jgi:hypothetical protein